MNPVGPVAVQSQPSQEETQRLDDDDVKEDTAPPDPFHNYSEDPDYKIVQRRHPPLSRNDTVFFDPITLKPISVHGPGAFLIPDYDLLQVHPLKFLKTDYETNPEMVAVAPCGRHVVLQQAIRACVPAAITMLALDLGGTPLYDFVLTKNLTSWEMELRMIAAAGFKAHVHRLPGKDSFAKAQILEKLLQKGPGLLHLSHTDLKGHVVVLDALSIQDNKMTWRDPYHGWMITARPSSMLDCVADAFIHFAPVKKSDVGKNLNLA